MTLNWTPVTESLFRHLWAAGITIAGVSNSERWIITTSIDDALEYADGVDEAWVRVRLDDERQATLYLVYGNNPDELVADYARTKSSSDDWIEAPLQRFADEWEGVPCPTVREPLPLHPKSQ